MSSEPLRPEAVLLLALTRLHLDEEAQARVRALIADHQTGLDWGVFVDLAARHRALPLVSRHILRHRLFHGETGLSVIPYRWLYEGVYEGNRQRNASLAEEFAEVMAAFEDAGVRYAVRKGPAIGEVLYGDPGLRRMSDLDLLVERHQTKDAGTALTALGYRQGRISADGTAVEEFSRRTQLFWRTNIPNELPFVKLAARPNVESYNVDICLNIFQPLSESRVEPGDLLDRRAKTVLCGRDSYALAPEDQFIDLCAHLHKEATALHYIERGVDLELLKFLDIALSAVQLTAEDWTRVRERTVQYGAGRSVYYALHHTVQLYPEAVPAAELGRFRPQDTGFLDEYGEFDGRIGTWQQPFIERLFNPHRRQQVSYSSAVPRV